MYKRFGFILFLTALLINVSCLNRHFINGRSELVSITDTTLNDSSIFMGSVRWVDWPINYTFQGPFEVWIENTHLKTTSDSSGYYFIKTIPGTYTIKCQSEGNEWAQLIEEMQNLEIMKNKKIRINFYIGYTVE
jgi:hypothetical protein